MIGTSFAVGLAGALFVLLILAAVTLRTLRAILNRVRLHLPSSLRHGLANLYRPGNQSAAVLAALGTGVMLILAVYLMQASLLREIRETASPTLPNVFLIDVTTDEVARCEGLLPTPVRREPGSRSDARYYGPVRFAQRARRWSS